MKFFNLSITGLILRFYLTMVVVIGSIFGGAPWLAILALPIFLSAMLGIHYVPVRRSHMVVKSRSDEKATQPEHRMAS